MQQNKLWRGIAPDEAERKARHLRNLLAHADQAIAAQQRINSREGSDPILGTALLGLVDERHRIERALIALLDHRVSEAVDFALDGDRYRHHTAPISVLAKVFESLSQLYIRICQSQSAKISKTVQQNFARMCELQAAGFFPSSFGVRLTVSTLNDTTGQSISRHGIEEMFKLFGAADPADVAADYGPWTIKQYRELINRMLSAEARPKIRWTSAFGEQQAWLPDSQRLLTLENRLARLRTEEAVYGEAEGMLLEASLVRNTFGIVARGVKIKGKVPQDLSAKVAACFGKQCRAVYEERRVIDEATDQEKKSTRLIDIFPLSA